MKLLALDTSSIACSVALRNGDAIFDRHEEQPREHTRLLMPMINAVLSEGGVNLTELDAIVLGNGPGSFIGMRIAASVAQGLAYGSGLRIVPVSSMAAVAARVFAESDAAEVVVAQDARMNEVYLGHYGRGSDGLPGLITPERLQPAAAIDDLDPAKADQRQAAGAGWQKYPRLKTENASLFAGFSPVSHPRARWLLGIAAEAQSGGLALAPSDICPAYLRQKVADKPNAAP